MKNLNDFCVGLFFCLEIKFQINLGMFFRFHLKCKRILSFFKIEKDEDTNLEIPPSHYPSPIKSGKMDDRKKELK